MGWAMVRQSVMELADSTSENKEDVDDVRFLALRVPGVRECRAVRLRQMGPYSVVDICIAFEDSKLALKEALAIKDKVRSEVLLRMPQVREVLIELDHPSVADGTAGRSTGDASIK